ncbi:MAG: hypothetical protein V4502_12500 [Pseudomonadota bacterium]
MLALPADRTRPRIKYRVEEDDEYFREITRSWGKMLNQSVVNLPDPPWLTPCGL